MRSATTAVCLAVLAGFAAGQQTGDQNRDYSINYTGSYQSSYIVHQVCVPLEGVSQQYYTTDPAAPVIWAASLSGSIGWFQTPTNSVDIGPNGIAFLLDGTFTTSTNPVNFFAVTDPGGYFGLNTGTTAGLAGVSLYLTMAHMAASSPDGFWVSQTHIVNFVTPAGAGTINLPPSTGTSCSAGATSLVLTDDSFVQRTLNGSGFPYYGTTYQQCFVGSNGYVTFGAGDTVYTENVSLFTSGPPRIATTWDDYNPGQGGTVSFFADPIGGFEVCFNSVPEFATLNSNSFRLVALAGFTIQFDYDANMASADGLIGLAPGNGGTVNPADLSNPPAGGNLIAPGTGLYEIFGGLCSPPMDLRGFQVTFLIDSSGNPVSQF